MYVCVSVLQLFWAFLSPTCPYCELHTALNLTVTVFWNSVLVLLEVARDRTPSSEIT